MNFNDQLQASQTLINEEIQNILSDIPDSELLRGMRYALNGGKRVRGHLTLASSQIFGLDRHGPLRAAAAIECMHAYSLVHDDLPCMDDDDDRRGRPSLHIEFNETMAVLVGDSLQALAFEIVAHPDTSQSAEIRAQLTLSLAKAAGANGMVLGQHLDLDATTHNKSLEVNDILKLHAKKTGALLSWSAQAGALLAGQDPKPLKDYADALGLAYQIIDDLLDEDSSEEESANLLNVRPRQDVQLLAEKYKEKSFGALEIYGHRALPLKELAQFVIERDD